MTKSGWTIIYQNELLENHRSLPGPYDWGLMMMLKRAGAPIVGVFHPSPDLDNYDWEMRQEAVNQYTWCYKFIWKPKEITYHLETRGD